MQEQPKEAPASQVPSDADRQKALDQQAERRELEHTLRHAAQFFPFL